MSMEAVDQFRAKINESPALQVKASEALNTSLPSVVELGSQYGYSFTEAEADQALTQYTTNEELSDYEMELVSAGSGCPQTASA